MKRLIVAATVLTLLLTTAIWLKIREQERRALEPPGGSGVIEGTAVNLSTKITARISRVAVKAGQAVDASDLLVQLDCDEVKAAIAEGEARVAAADAQQRGAAASTDAAKRATGAAYAQAVAAKKRNAALATRVASAERDVRRLELVGDGITVAQLDQSQAEALSLALEREAQEQLARASSAQAGVAQAQSGAAAASSDAAHATLEQAKASLDRTLLLRRECEIRAPRAAVVEDVYFEEGELASPGTTIVRLVDLDEVTITFYLPNAELAAIAADDAAQVAVDAYPDRVFPGHVTTIATEAAFTPRNIQTRTDRDRLVFPVEVTLANPDHALRPGMPAQVSLVRHE